MTRALLALALSLPLAGLTGCVVFVDTHRADAALDEAATHVPGAALEVETVNGGITVLAGTGADVRVEGDFQCTGGSDAEARERARDARLDVRRAGDDTLRVSGACGGGYRTNDGLTLRVVLPDVRDLRLTTTNGAIETEGTDGLLYARSSNGGITVSDHVGDLDAVTSNGPIDGDGVAGEVFAESSNGAITLRLGDDASGPVEARTTNGAVRLEVGASFWGRVTFDTSNGSVDVDDRAGRVTRTSLGETDGWVEIGSGGPTSTLDTSNGDIDLVVLR